MLADYFLVLFYYIHICSIQNGIVYALLTSKSRFIYLLFREGLIEKLIQKDKSNTKQEDSA